MLIATLLLLVALVCITVELTASCYPVSAEERNGYALVRMADGRTYFLADRLRVVGRTVDARYFIQVELPAWRGSANGKQAHPLKAWACGWALRQAWRCEGREWSR